MNADSLLSWVRGWLNARLSHRHICVHRRPSAAKFPFFWITQPKPNAARQGPGPLHPHAAARPGPTAPFKPFRTDPLNREPTAKPGSTAPFEPSRIDPLNREPTAKAGPPAPSVAGSNAFSAAATAQPARALHPIALTVIAAAGDAGARLVFDTQGGPSMIGAEHAPR